MLLKERSSHGKEGENNKYLALEGDPSGRAGRSLRKRERREQGKVGNPLL